MWEEGITLWVVLFHQMHMDSRKESSLSFHMGLKSPREPWAEAPSPVNKLTPFHTSAEEEVSSSVAQQDQNSSGFLSGYKTCIYINSERHFAFQHQSRESLLNIKALFHFQRMILAVASDFKFWILLLNYNYRWVWKEACLFLSYLFFGQVLWDCNLMQKGSKRRFSSKRNSCHSEERF